MSSDDYIEDSFETENTNSESFLTSNELSSDETVEESLFLKNTRKKKIGVIDSESETELNQTDLSYRLFSENSIGRSSVIPHKNVENNNKTLYNNSKATEEENTIGSVRIIDNSFEDIIEVSSDEEVRIENNVKQLKQTTMLNYTISAKKSQNNKPSPRNELVVLNEKTDNLPTKKIVPPEVYKEQSKKVEELIENFMKAEKALKMINTESLFDKGELLKKRYNQLKEKLEAERQIFSNMHLQDSNENPSFVPWEEIQLGAVAVHPRTFGRQALETYNAQKALTMDRLKQIHGSLNACPDENMHAEPPKRLKSELMPHQKRALAWLMWREEQKPSGGILADDMGLGKTLTMISLIVMHKQNEEENDEDEDNSSDEENSNQRNSKFRGGTLIVCPASLVQQWEGEVNKHVKKNTLAVELYYGNKREARAKRLARQDMVITTYGLVQTDLSKNGPLFSIRWRRIILDEAHEIRNHKTRTSQAVCVLSAKSRWALTGTPVHNKELDLYALLKFLRCAPFDDLSVWKRWIDKKDTGGQERLNTVISSLLLRRTKEQLQRKGALQCLPEKQWDLISVKFYKEEFLVYKKILLLSQALFSEFLHQKSMKNQNVAVTGFAERQGGANYDEYLKTYKMVKKNFMNENEIKQTSILTLILRLQQICCHPSLIKGMLDEDEDLSSAKDEERQDEVLEKLMNLTLKDDENENEVENTFIDENKEARRSDAAKLLLNPSNPIFSKERKSSKVAAILDCLKKILSSEDKAIVVSRWTSYLQLIGFHLKECGIKFEQFDGSLQAMKRQDIVERFNDPTSKVKVLLLSLKSGGVGLNLIGANHLLLADLHWNPQLEQQAQDRIYRVGQKKKVNVYKFMVAESIEEKIKGLQDKKLLIAEQVLTGAKTNQNILSLEDLRMLFQL